LQRYDCVTSRSISASDCAIFHALFRQRAILIRERRVQLAQPLLIARRFRPPDSG
jgi:hypothetical protein